MKENKRKKLIAHAAEYRYYVKDKSVAAVSKKGKIKGLKKGTTIVYVIANNGAYKKIKVKVK